MAKKIEFHGPRQKHFIKEWRAYRGLTQEQVADRVGTSKVSISRIESGDQPYSEESLHAIAEALSCSVADLVSRDPNALPMISMQGLPEDDAIKVREYIRGLGLVRERDAGQPAEAELLDTPKRAPARRGRKAG